MSNNLQPKISICIPTYNGLPYITILMDELLNSSITNFDIVISDDCSTDGTWEYVSALSSVHDRVKCFRNSNNLGMDRNFSKSVALAIGEYVWLCGQDDIIMHQGIEVVTKLLTDKSELDFVYLNHVKVNEVLHQNVNFAMHLNYANHHVYGHGLNEYLNYHDYELPTFLPKYILRKELWESVDVGKYFGTYYCQVGVFLETSQNLNWCHLDGNYVVGLTPSKGWQSDPEKFARISIGIYSMLFRAFLEMDYLSAKIPSRLINKNYKSLLLSCLLIKGRAVQVDENKLAEVLSLIKCSPRSNFLINTILAMPNWFSISILCLIKGRRKLRKSVGGISSQGPNFD